MKAWKKWFETDAPEEEQIPFPGKMDPFKRLLLIRAWCLDRMISQVDGRVFGGVCVAHDIFSVSVRECKERERETDRQTDEQTSELNESIHD